MIRRILSALVWLYNASDLSADRGTGPPGLCPNCGETRRDIVPATGWCNRCEGTLW